MRSRVYSIRGALEHGAGAFVIANLLVKFLEIGKPIGGHIHLLDLVYAGIPQDLAVAFDLAGVTRERIVGVNRRRQLVHDVARRKRDVKAVRFAIDLMRPSDEYPVGLESTPLADIVSLLTKVPTGGINIVNNTNEKYLIGLITDGDIRRALLRKEEFFKLCAGDIMTRNPITITPDTLASKALELMENRKSQLMVLPVVDRAGKAFGILRLHDILCP